MRSVCAGILADVVPKKREIAMFFLDIVQRDCEVDIIEFTVKKIGMGKV